MSWRDHAVGALAGPVEVRCDGRSEGDHDPVRIAVWWLEADGWHMWAGRPHTRVDLIRRREGVSLGGRPRREVKARMRCRCGLDYRRGMTALAPILDAVAATRDTPTPSVMLRSLVRVG